MKDDDEDDNNNNNADGTLTVRVIRKNYSYLPIDRQLDGSTRPFNRIELSFFMGHIPRGDVPSEWRRYR